MKGPLYLKDVTDGWKKILWTDQHYWVGSFCRNDAGFWMWEEVTNHDQVAMWTAYALRLIADKLDELNAPIHKELAEAYNELNKRLEKINEDNERRAKHISYLEPEIEELQRRLERLRDGEELVPAEYVYSDDEYILRCPDCKRANGTCSSRNEIPFVRDLVNGGKCYQCSKSPEQKAEEARKLREKTEAAEREQLRILIEKYGEKECQVKR